MRRWIANTSLVFCSIVLSIGVGELCVRWFLPQTLGVWSMSRDGLTMHYPLTKSHHVRFGTDIEINSWGMRDREHPLEKDPAVFRILLLGDSFLEAVQVPFSSSFPSLLEANLDFHGQYKRVEVINASVSGWGTDDELTYFLRYGYKFHPDLILIGMTIHNDISDNLREKFHEVAGSTLKARPAELIPFWEYVLLETKGLLARNLHLYQMFLSFSRADANSDAARQLNTHLAQLVSKTATPQMDKGWQLTFQLFKELRTASKKIGAEVAVLLIPLWIQVSDAQHEQFLKEYQLELGDIDLDRPQRMMKQFGLDEGIRVIDLQPEFKDWEQRHEDDLYLKGDAHWTVSGHRLASELVAYVLRDWVLRSSSGGNEKGLSE